MEVGFKRDIIMDETLKQTFIGCGSGAPGVYINSTSYLDWIASVIKQYGD